MKRNWTLIFTALVLGALALSASGCQKLRARDNLNRGVQAYRSANYSTAVERFKEAVRLDPTFQTARLYLATAYMSQWIPGAESPENQQMAKAAKENFLKVLEADPKNTIALGSLAYMNFQEAGSIQDADAKVKKFDEAQDWYTKLVTVDPNNKEAYYSLGVIAWSKWYPAYGSARAKLGMKQEDPGPLKDRKVREELRAKWNDVIDVGITNLTKALNIDKNYDEAMAYMNLLYRERGDLAENANEYKKDIETADMWLQKAMDTRKAKAAATTQGGLGTTSGK